MGDNTYFMVQLTHVKLHAVRTLLLQVTATHTKGSRKVQTECL